MASQLEAGQPLHAERYALPAAVLAYPSYSELLTPEIEIQKNASTLTLLEALQADIALLRNPSDSDKIPFAAYDGTIQIHAAPKPMREVQVVYDAIMHIIDKHSQDAAPILPGEIVVMVPDLASYHPFIRTVFEAPESHLTAQLMDLQIPAHQPFLQAFLHLLRLPLGRWDSLSLLQLFAYPAFQLRHQIKADEMQLIHAWVKNGGIYWGKDSSHRNELLRRDHCDKEMVEESGHGTWEHGLGRLLDGLAMSAKLQAVDDEMPFSPLELIDTNQGEFLGSLLQLLRSLLADLKPLMDDTKLSLSDWSAYLQCLCEAYLDTTGDGAEGYQLLMEQLAAIRQADIRLHGRLFAFHSIRRQLEQCLQTETMAYRESNLQAVRFCSLLPMRAVPAKVIMLMGMGDGQFPRHDQTLSLNLLSAHPLGDYYPTQTDFDRYLFLEALLSARRYFIATYVSQQPGNPQEELPSLLLTELLSYIDKAYCLPSGILSHACYRKHPLSACDKSYFAAATPFKSYSSINYLASLARYQPQKNAPHSFLDACIPHVVDNQSAEMQTAGNDIVVELAELVAFAKNPLKAYFNKNLDIYFERQDDRRIKIEEEMLLSRLNASILLKDAVLAPTNALLKRASKNGQLPSGPFRGLESARLSGEIESLRDNLAALGVDTTQLFAIEFNARHAAAKSTEKGWQLPPLCVDVPAVGRVHIVGRLDMVSAQGLIALAEDDVKEVIKLWPLWLAFCCLIQTHALPIAESLLFAKGKKGSAKTAPLDQPKVLLSHFLAYYFKGLKSPSPLMPECVTPMLAGSFDTVRKVFQTPETDEFVTVYDACLKWLRRSSPKADVDAAMPEWQAMAKTLFVDMHKAWYPKKLTKTGDQKTGDQKTGDIDA